MENTLDQQILRQISLLDEARKESLLHLLKTFTASESSPFERIGIDEYNQELERSERQIDAGRFTTQEDLEKEMEQW